MPAVMEPSKVKYAYIEEGVERLDYYVRGGYHPVNIGDEFREGRYVIAHKLGFGRSATTWLAEDKETKKLVALKISTAESVERTHEEQILLRLAKCRSALPGKAIVQTLLDSFTFSGPNGTHRCLVTDAARVSIHVTKDMAYHRLLQLEVARAIASQLILALQFIHAQGVVHGDLHAGNILLHLPPNIRSMTREQLYINIGRPDKEPVVRIDGSPLDNRVPLKVVFPVLLGLGSDEIKLVDSSILLADFGEAFDPQRTQRFTAHAPIPLSPPESRFADEPLSFPSDIWTLGCVIWDLFGSSPPFEAFPGSQDDITVEHVETFGKLPDRWWSKWETRSDWFDEDGHKNVKESLQQYYGNTSRGWTQRFADINISRKSKKLEAFGTEEEKSFHDMMRSMLVLEPSKRASIDDVVRCEWVQRWGLPEFQRIQSALRE